MQLQSAKPDCEFASVTHQSIKLIVHLTLGAFYWVTEGLRRILIKKILVLLLLYKLFRSQNRLLPALVVVDGRVGHVTPRSHYFPSRKHTSVHFSSHLVIRECTLITMNKKQSSPPCVVLVTSPNLLSRTSIHLSTPSALGAILKNTYIRAPTILDTSRCDGRGVTRWVLSGSTF